MSRPTLIPSRDLVVDSGRTKSTFAFNNPVQ